MRILIDTHIYLWALSCPEKLNEKRRYELESRSNQIFLSAMSIAELMIKQSIGKMVIDFDTLEKPIKEHEAYRGDQQSQNHPKVPPDRASKHRVGNPDIVFVIVHD